MKPLSEVVFAVALNGMRRAPKRKQKLALTDCYERGVISGEQLEYAIKHLKLEAA